MDKGVRPPDCDAGTSFDARPTITYAAVNFLATFATLANAMEVADAKLQTRHQ